MNNLYNTQFEIELRALLLLSSATKQWLSEGEIFVFDFIVSYGKEFEICEKNLHGDSSFKFSEVTLRKGVIGKAIKDLVVKGLIDVEANKEKGFLYKASTKGLSYIGSFDDDYTLMYKDIAEKAFKAYQNKDESYLTKLIQNKARARRN